MDKLLQDWLPILMSFVAIFISIYTVQKQNKIALFNERYKVFKVWNFLLSVCQNLLSYDSAKANLVLHTSMEVYRNSLTSSDPVINGTDISSFYTGVFFEAAKAEHLFNVKQTQSLMKLLTVFDELFSNIRKQKPCDDGFEQLQKIFTKIEKDKSINKLAKSIKL